MALVAAAVLAGPLTAPAQTPVAVAIRGFAFQPAELSVGVGTTVRWTNLDGAPHQVESDDGTLAGPAMGTRETFSFTFAAAGRITYHCAIHPSMTAVIVVQ